MSRKELLDGDNCCYTCHESENHAKSQSEDSKYIKATLDSIKRSGVWRWEPSKQRCPTHALGTAIMSPARYEKVIAQQIEILKMKAAVSEGALLYKDMWVSKDASCSKRVVLR